MTKTKRFTARRCDDCGKPADVIWKFGDKCRCDWCEARRVAAMKGKARAA